MYINLQLSDDQCNELVSRLGYKIETVTLYYYKDIDPYGKCKKPGNVSQPRQVPSFEVRPLLKEQKFEKVPKLP